MFVPSPAKKNSVYCICKPEWKEVRGLKKADLTRAILETTISKALRDIQVDPERSIRNLVDLGRSFSNGRFQKEFFRFAQTMLENEHSAYYPLVKDVVDQVNPQTLQTFGINIGYNACTHGAKQIRANEAKFGFNIPWAIAFQMAAAPGSMQLADFCSMIDQGMELGVYTYLLFWDARPAREIVPLLQKYPDCAFFLFAPPQSLVADSIPALQTQHNLLVSVHADADGFLETAGVLRERGFLYGLHTKFGTEQVAEIVNGAWLQTVLPAKPIFVFLLPQNTAIPGRQEIHQYVTATRAKQMHPLFLVDIYADILEIDKIISEDACSLGFDANGQVITIQGRLEGEAYNMRTASLASILKKCAAKA